MTYVGKSVPHDSARGHVSGESIYVDDMPRLANELQVGFFWSPVARGRIRSIDLEDAKHVNGVVALFLQKDIGGEKLFGSIFQDEVLLADSELTYIGQPVVLIAAESRKAIDEARKRIRIDIEELEPILTIDEAIARQSLIGQTRFIRRGDAEAAIRTAPSVIEGTFRCGGQDHFYLESQAAIAIPDEHGSLVIHSSTQNPTELQHVIAHQLGIRQSDVVVISKRMGGGFGGKECQATHPGTMAAVVAHLTRRPARIAYTKDEDMVVTGKRHRFQNRYRIGYDDSGRIFGMQVALVSDGGAFADLSPAIMSRAMTHAENAYFIPDIDISGTICRTNNPPNTAMRGFGAPQGMATIECAIEEIAQILGKDPLEVRRVNCYGITDRNVTPYGEVVENNTLPRIFDMLEKTSDYRSRRAAVIDFNRSSKTHLKGIAVTAIKFGISFNTTFLNQGNALVNVYLDGTVQVSTGATEMGQGVYTKIAQVVADELGIDIASVRVMPTSTEKNNNTSATAASTGADLNCSAAVDACSRIRERLAACAASLLAAGETDVEFSPASVIFSAGQVWHHAKPEKRMSFKELVHAAHRRRVNLGERGFYATKGIHFNFDTMTGRPFLYYTCGAAVSEVLIDRFTGMMTVPRVDLLIDIGRPLNPGIDRGQITGGFIQGMGWCTGEELLWDDKGNLLTHSPTTYKIPNIQDVPEVFNVATLDNDTNRANIKGSKAVGEPPLPLAISVWMAVKQALGTLSEGKPAELQLPATIEEVAMRIAALERR